MLQRLYVHNFRCLTNFEWSPDDSHHHLLLGKNGTGKSSIGAVLAILQKLGQGRNRVEDLLLDSDFGYGNLQTPLRTEIDVRLADAAYHYSIAFDRPANLPRVRVVDEALRINGQSVFERKLDVVSMPNTTQFTLDWHSAGLTLIEPRGAKPDIERLTQWLAHMLILAPMPEQMQGDANDSGTLFPQRNLANLGAWFFGMHSTHPEAYGMISDMLKQFMPEFHKIVFEQLGRHQRGMRLAFQADGQSFDLEFSCLSDGEKCFFAAALAIAANQCYGPLLCFWDEPDNYVSLSEVQHLIADLRRGFAGRGQLIVTSHDTQTILGFPLEQCALLTRKSRLEPARIKMLDESQVGDSLINALLIGSLDES